jgi:hypothetical protein
LGAGAGVEATDGLVVGDGGVGLQPRRETEMAMVRVGITRVRRCERIFTFM